MLVSKAWRRDARAVRKLRCIVEEKWPVFVISYKSKGLFLKQVFRIFRFFWIFHTVRYQLAIVIINIVMLTGFISAMFVLALHIESVILWKRFDFTVSHQVMRKESMSA